MRLQFKVKIWSTSWRSKYEVWILSFKFKFEVVHWNYVGVVNLKSRFEVEFCIQSLKLNFEFKVWIWMFMSFSVRVPQMWPIWYRKIPWGILSYQIGHICGTRTENNINIEILDPCMVTSQQKMRRVFLIATIIINLNVEVDVQSLGLKLKFEFEVLP